MAEKQLKVTAARIDAAVIKVESLPDNGVAGNDGVTFTANVDSKGNLSWSNNGGLSNPTTVNIKGEAGPQGPQGEKGNNAVNPNFTIGTVTTLAAGSNATVSISGTYPNLVLNFGIPRGADGSGSGTGGGTGGNDPIVPPVEYMYYGRLSAAEVGIPPIKQYNQVTADMIVNGANITKAEPSTLGKTSMGLASTTAEGDYVIVAVPKSKNYTVTKDNGIGGKVQFNEETAGSNGTPITINGIEYVLYGELLFFQAEIFIYID